MFLGKGQRILFRAGHPCAILCNPVVCKARRQAGQAKGLFRLHICRCCPLHVPTKLLPRWVSTESTYSPPVQIPDSVLWCQRKRFLGTISPVFVDIQRRRRRRSAAVPAQLSFLRRGRLGRERGENGKNSFSTNKTALDNNDMNLCLCLSHFASIVHIWLGRGSFSALATKLRSLLEAEQLS